MNIDPQQNRGISRPDVQSIFNHSLKGVRASLRPSSSPTKVSLRGWQAMILTIEGQDFEVLGSKGTPGTNPLLSDLTLQTSGLNQPRDLSKAGFALLRIEGENVSVLLTASREELSRIQAATKD